MYLAFWLLVGHAVCDFPLQGDVVAREKSPKSTSELQKHVPWYYWLMPSALVAKTGMNLVNEYAETTKQPVEIHYTLIDGVNDQQEDIDGLLELVNTNVLIKLLRFSPYKNEPTLFESNRVSWFKDTLERNGYTIEVYCSPGRDINASCGQFIGNQYTKISNG